MLTGCSENLYEDHFPHSKIKTQKVSLNDNFLKQNSKLMKTVNRVKKMNDISQSKIIYDTINNFYIDDENGMLLDYNGAISYSFRVLRESTTENSKVENIIFNQTETGDYDSYLLKYGFTKTELDALAFSGANTINYEIEDVDVLVSNKATTPKCRTIRVSMCSGVPWDCGGGICGYDYVIQCDEGSGGGGTSSEGGGSSGGINTIPTGGGGIPQTFPDTPCGRLQKGTSSNVYKQNFKSLNKPEKFSLPFESGFAQKMTNGNLSYSYLRGSNGKSLSMPSGSLNYTHVHNNHIATDSNGDTYDRNVKILSPADVTALITTCQNASVAANINPAEAFGIMISNEGIFAITLLEPMSLAELGQLTSKWKTFEDKYREKASNIVTDTNLDASGRKNALQKMLLSLLKDLGLENKVGLFEGEVEDDIDSININWTKKTLNPTNPNTNPVETPC